VSVDDAKRLQWEMKARSELARFHLIERTLLRELKKDRNRPFVVLAADINFWCSQSTIAEWFNQLDDSFYYIQRIIPHLSAIQKQAHVDFARAILAGFIPLMEGVRLKRPTLLINWDEKLFEGLVARMRAKAAPSAGLPRENLQAKNKQSIPKGMFLCFVGIALESGDIRDGGDGLKLGLYRAQRARIAGTSRRTKEFKAGVEDAEEWLYRKGDPVLRDCTVRGSDSGTSSNPHFDLLSFFMYVFFPFLLTIVGENATMFRGKYKGWRVIFQGDNASCHTNKHLLEILKAFCLEHDWWFLFQAAHAPHMNLCDLCVFPALSKATDRQRGNNLLGADKLALACQRAWDAYPSSKLASGFVTLLGVAEKVIQERGNTDFLGNMSMHYGTRKQYNNTRHGVVRIEN